MSTPPDGEHHILKSTGEHTWESGAQKVNCCAHLEFPGSFGYIKRSERARVIRARKGNFYMGTRF